MSDLTNQDLQIKLAYLERHIEEQDKVIYLLRNDFDKLAGKLERLEERLDSSSSSSGPASSNEERPPHY